MQVLIDGVDRTNIVDLKTLRIQDAIGERSTCSFVVNDLDNALGPLLVPGETIEIIHDGVKLFGGTIDRAVQVKVGANTPKRQYAVDCVDWHQICDRRIVAETYENMAAGEIVRDLVAKYLDAEGVHTAQNLLTANQSSVETDLTGFGSVNSTREQSSDYAFQGTKSLKTIANGVGVFGPYVPNVSVVAGRLYTFSVYVRSGLGTYNVRVVIEWRRADYSFISASRGTYCPLLPSWTRLAVTGRAPPGAAKCAVTCYTQQVGVAGDCFYSDGFQFEYGELSEWKLGGTTLVVQTGPTVIEAVFNYVPATTCLDKLAELAGFSWWIDANKVLHFVERATYSAPWVLDDPAKVNNLRIEKHRQGYRNRQFVKAGKDITDPQVESFKGDGASRTWTVGFPIAKVPTVKVNGVTKTVGIKGIDTGKDFYWNKGDPVITQDSAGTILTSSDTLEVTYQGFFDVVVLTDDYAAIEERKSVEGGTGYYEAVEDEPYLSSREAAIQSANAKLRKYAKLTKQITFDTYLPGLRPGQILNVNLPDRGLVNEEFLIESVEFSEIGGGYWNYSVKAVSGEALGGWTKFFKNMASRGQAFVIRENIREDQVLIRLVQSQEGWTWGEQHVQTLFACPIPGETLYPSDTLYPC